MQGPTHDQVLKFVQEKSRPFVKTAEVAEQFNSVSRRTIFNRLEDLADRGDVVKHSVTDSVAVWYEPDQVESARASSPASDSQ